jgi:hypothetical protein
LRAFQRQALGRGLRLIANRAAHSPAQRSRRRTTGGLRLKGIQSLIQGLAVRLTFTIYSPLF